MLMVRSCEFLCDFGWCSVPHIFNDNEALNNFCVHMSRQYPEYDMLWNQLTLPAQAANFVLHWEEMKPRLKRVLARYPQVDANEALKCFRRELVDEYCTLIGEIGIGFVEGLTVWFVSGVCWRASDRTTAAASNRTRGSCEGTLSLFMPFQAHRRCGVSASNGCCCCDCSSVRGVFAALLLQ